MIAHEWVKHGGGNGGRDRLGAAWRREQIARDEMEAETTHRMVHLLQHSVTGPTAVYGSHVMGVRCARSATTGAELNRLNQFSHPPA